MKNYYKNLVAVALFLCILGGGIWHYQNKEVTIAESLPVTKGDVILKNVQQTPVQIKTRFVDKINLNLTGPADQLRRIHFKKTADNLVEISFPEDADDIQGTITIPNNLRIVDLDLPPRVSFVPDTAEVTPPSLPTPLPRNSSKKIKVEPTIGQNSAPNNESLISNTSNSTNPSRNPNNNPSNNDSNSSNGNSNNSGNQTNANANSNNNPSNNSGNTNSNNGNSEPPSNNNDNTNPITPPYSPICGNSILDSLIGETCDDGNLQSGDGCSDNCKIEMSSNPICGNQIIETGEECDDGNLDNNDSCNNSCQLDIYQKWAGQRCSIDMKQDDRNECCRATMVDQPHRSCDGEWQFEYFSRLCVWYCPNERCANRETSEEKQACCQAQNQNSPTPPCAGQWDLNEEKGQCEFQCSVRIESTERRTIDEVTQTSQYCTNTYTDKDNQNQCCDDFLKHPLSIGPRPGFPDCIGRWSVPPGTNQCQFSCIPHEEMLEILKDLRQRKQQEP